MELICLKKKKKSFLSRKRKKNKTDVLTILVKSLQKVNGSMIFNEVVCFVFRLGPCELPDPVWAKMSAVTGATNKKRKKTDSKPQSQM